MQPMRPEGEAANMKIQEMEAAGKQQGRSLAVPLATEGALSRCSKEKLLENPGFEQQF